MPNWKLLEYTPEWKRTRAEEPKNLKSCFKRSIQKGVVLSRHHSWCCVKGRLHAAARRRRVKKYCQCGKGGRQFRRPRWLMFRRRLKLGYGCTTCSGSTNCCHESSPTATLKLNLPPSKSILHHSPQISPKSNQTECACTKTTNCGDKMVQQAAIHNICRFTVDAYFT